MKKEEFQKYRTIIKSCPIFKGLSDDELEKTLLASCSILHIDAEKQLDSSYFYIVLEGAITIKKAASDNREVTMNLAVPPAAINIVSALSGITDLSVMTAAKDSCVLKFKKGFLKSSLNNGGQLAINISMFLSNRIIFLNHRLSSLAGYSASCRLMMYFNDHAKNGTVDLNMSISSFADYLGVGRASLYRSFEELEEKHVIKRNGRHIELLF